FYANGLKGAFANVPAIVCGAGPSLDPALLNDTRALILAGGSAVTALSAHGVIPHFGMAIDPNLEEYRRFRSSLAFEMPLLYSTRLFPAVFQTCDGPFGYMRSGIGGASELWIEEELGLQGPLLGEHLSEEAISVTAICLAWAVFLGCNPIVLSGVDLAYTNQRRYAAGVTDEVLAVREIEQEKSAPDRIVRRKGKDGKALYTAVRWLIEARGLSRFAAHYPDIQFLNASRGLPIRGFADGKIQLGPKRDFRADVQRAIARSPMPANTAEVIQAKLQELTKSLERVVDHLAILAGKKHGSTALAELDLREELAFAVLFYDVDALFPREEKWEHFLHLAEQYLLIAS
ncbi:MAG TPA: 6-hydroxymethylpterin diphosphokinase MptE-like protein, partial [bacterium]|nr:6-hydroxymethylpterin diphosphokinase MptE-like protein [bacterium]